MKTKAKSKPSGPKARLIDQHDKYNWVEHAKIRHIAELHPPE